MKRGKVLKRESSESKELTVTAVHLQAVALMGLVFVFGSFMVPTIDRETLKPSEDFPIWLKNLSRLSNVPIKIGFVHAYIYAFEILRSPKLFPYHLGQRLTTLWVQFFEHHRWGQHLHMQVETVLQLVDLLGRDSYSAMERGVLYGLVGLFFFTNFITSTAYHTWEEQSIGFVIALVKLAVDYSVGAQWNKMVGETMQSRLAIGGGLSLLALEYALVTYLFASTEVSRIVFHPTIIATTLFTGASGVRLIQSHVHI